MTTAPTPSEAERLASNLEHEWTTVADMLQAAATLRQQHAEIKAMRETLEFVERWAVHHASKPHMTAELALGSIQHHPEIRAITERYADGKRPETFDPYARIAELESRKPLPLSDDDRLRLRSDVARAIWDVMREHEDRCGHALEDVDHKHQVWDCADAAIETALGIIPRPNPLIASREVISGGPVRVTRLHLTEEGRAGLASKATGPLPGITGGSS